MQNTHKYTNVPKDQPRPCLVKTPCVMITQKECTPVSTLEWMDQHCKKAVAKYLNLLCIAKNNQLTH